MAMGAASVCGKPFSGLFYLRETDFRIVLFAGNHFPDCFIWGNRFPDCFICGKLISGLFYLRKTVFQIVLFAENRFPDCFICGKPISGLLNFAENIYGRCAAVTIPY
jgi:hypothetical protein